MNFDDFDLNDLYAHSVEFAKKFWNNKKGEGQEELQKMRMDATTKRGRGSISSKKSGKNGAQATGGKNAKKTSSSRSGTSSNNMDATTNSGNEEDIDKGGKYDTKKALLNKFKFKAQKNSKEEAKAEAEANRCDPCNEFKAGNGLDLGCVDWGKCAYVKPCVKKFPYPCGCMAYLCFGVTFVGGLIGSIILF